MASSAFAPIRTRQEIEAELFEAVHLAKMKWLSATGDERTAARQRFMEVLHTFNALIIHGRLP
jgi:hypothetical protein